MSFNKVIIVGHLGRDPELRYTPQGIPVCTFSVATSEKRKDNKSGVTETGAGEVTTWFRVTLWREKAELASKYLAKGRQVYVEGRLSAREWQDKDGVQRTTLEVSGTELHFLDNRAAGEGIQRDASRASTSSPGGTSVEAPPEVTDDDIPF